MCFGSCGSYNYCGSSYGPIHLSTTTNPLSWKQRDEVRTIVRDEFKSQLNRFIKLLPKALKLMEEMGVVDR